MSSNAKRALEVAQQLNKYMTCYDFPYFVIVYHDDGTFHIMRSALAYEWDEYYLVFAEHAQPQVFHKEESTVFQLKEVDKDVTNSESLPHVRDLVIDNLPVRKHAFALKPEAGQHFWIMEKEHKHRGRTVQITQADAFVVRATENFPRESMWGPGEKEAWLAKQAAKKADPEWQDYERLKKKFEEDE